MRILSVYSPADAGILRLWERSWRSNGWKPGLITPKELHEDLARDVARRRRSRYLQPARLINYGLRPPRPAPKKLSFKRYGAPGWQTAKLVLFPLGMTEAEILTARPE